MVKTGFNVTTVKEFESMLRKYGKVQFHVLRRKDGSIYYEPCFVYGNRPKRKALYKVINGQKKKTPKKGKKGNGHLIDYGTHRYGTCNHLLNE